MPFTDAVHWTAGDFVCAGVLLFGPLALYEAAARRVHRGVHRAGIALGLLATVVLLWTNAAVHVTDSAADALYSGAALLGLVGSIVAIWRPTAGGRVLLATCGALAGTCAGAWAAGYVPNVHVSLVEALALTGLYAALYGAAAVLLLGVARQRAANTA